MDALIAFWTHALAAALFAALVLWELRGGRVEDDQRMLLAAFALTGCWAWLTAIEPDSMLAAYSESARNLVWVGVLYRLADPSGDKRQQGVRPVYAAVAGVLGLQMLVDGLALLPEPGDLKAASALAMTALTLRITAAAGALVLVHNLYGQASPSSRGGIRFAMLALALVWGFDLNLYTVAYFDTASARVLFDWRGAVVALAAPLFAFGRGPREKWRVKLSRAATFQSLGLLALCAYFAMMTILATALRGSGVAFGQLIGVAALAVMTLGAMVLLPSARARGWAKVKVAKHLFEHRYDYRAEWLRFTDTLGASGTDTAPLGERVVRAFAEILDAPGGILLTAEEGGFAPAAGWRWRGHPSPGRDASPEAVAQFWRSVESEGRILDFEARREGRGEARDTLLSIPADLLTELHAWVGIPLIHEGKLGGIVVLTAPEYARDLDWEDFDLLRTAGRQAASNLAEAYGQQALMNAQRFEDFNRRFAFILHDIKNLVSQLSLVSRNAERHAGNPEFQADMVATLKSSVGKMNELLQRIAPKGEQRALIVRGVALRPLLSRIIAERRRERTIDLSGNAGLTVLADDHALEQALGHLIQNAVDVTAPADSVVVRVDAVRGGVAISISDHGPGMDSDFIRTRLFEPFASTKPGGFGVGAFEARSLVVAMGGRLTVDSRLGAGTRFTIHLPEAATAEGHEPRRKQA